MAFFDPDGATKKYRRSLPHWQQNENTYFITSRLFDSLPSGKLNGIREEMALWHKVNPEPHSAEQEREFTKRFTRRIHRWLDQGYGACFLKDPAAREAVTSTLRFFDGERYRLGEFIVMPNHLHALVTPLADHQLEKILHSWKSYSAKKINAVFGRTGQVWQHESFDHLIRSPEQLLRIEWYIRNNPRIGGNRCL